uniref:Uncharacterized protein n=1 Tax=Phlegmariurus squarrosus TaxID=73615 RepID=H9M8C1_PHLSQ|nr:hypothetical protein HusqMp66 [Phlegmariurus squarrosus]AEV55828.1 hypothetical protein HusqMp66 [Phlegmariurus squarrosus]
MELGNDLTRIEEERKRLKLVRKLRITHQCFRDLEFVRIKYARYADDSFSGVAGGGASDSRRLAGRCWLRCSSSFNRIENSRSTHFYGIRHAVSDRVLSPYMLVFEHQKL